MPVKGWGMLRGGLSSVIATGQQKLSVQPAASPVSQSPIKYAPVPTSEGEGRGVRTVPDVLVHYDALEIDEDLQMATAMQDELGYLWLLGSRGWASQCVNSVFMALSISTIITVDILVSINLEPNPAAGYEHTWFDEFAHVLDIVATSFFTAEAALRMHAMTFNGYFTCGFNQLDAVVVFTSWCSILFESFSIDLGPLRAFRVFRVLKEIRFLSSLQAIMVRVVSAEIQYMQY